MQRDDWVCRQTFGYGACSVYGDFSLLLYGYDRILTGRTSLAFSPMPCVRVPYTYYTPTIGALLLTSAKEVLSPNVFDK